MGLKLDGIWKMRSAWKYFPPADITFLKEEETTTYFLS